MWNSLWTFISPLTVIINLLKEIKMDQAQLASEIGEIKATVAKAGAEIVAKIANLEQKIEEAGQVSPAVQEALAELKLAAKAVDDIVPDPAPAPQPE